MNLLTPDYTYSNIYKVDYTMLKKKGIKYLLFDLDNTCIGYKEKEPNDKLIHHFHTLEKDGFMVIIFSNARKKRLEPFVKMGIICNHFSKKPLKWSFKKIMKKYSLSKEETCIIGDQLFTDVLGGNRVGIKTCLVPPLTKEDFIVTKLFRKLENKILKR